ncbi:MAG: hypothetical protein H7831_10405, partial [Magnetococcus sp. WYHC-3]
MTGLSHHAPVVAADGHESPGVPSSSRDEDASTGRRRRVRRGGAGNAGAASGDAGVCSGGVPSAGMASAGVAGRRVRRRGLGGGETASDRDGSPLLPAGTATSTMVESSEGSRAEASGAEASVGEASELAGVLRVLRPPRRRRVRG